MRVFVAVELDDAVVRAAREAAEALRRKVEGRVRATWTEPEKMHLTVRFIGEVPDARVGAVLDALRPPLQIPEFDLALGPCGAFPSGGRPRVFWIGIARGADELRQMHGDFNRRLLPLGFQPEDRPFSAHLTLARVKDSEGSPRALRDAIDSVHPAPARCRIRAATVFQSQLSPKGARYTRLIEVPLCEPASADRKPPTADRKPPTADRKPPTAN